MVTLLTESDLKSILTMREVMDSVEEGFKQLAIGTVKMPIRQIIRIEKYNGLIAYMPAYVAGKEALAIKVASSYPSNPTSHNLQTVLGTVLLNDPRTGKLICIMDGNFVTSMRTGAVSGIATKYLARKNAKLVGIFGCGIQAKYQLIAINEVRRLECVKAYDVITRARDKFCEEMTEKLGIQLIAVDNPKEAVTNSDIIVTSTISKEPVFNGEWLESGSHINGIGSHHGRGIRELDEITIKRAKVVVDSKEACLKEAGDLIDPIEMGIISERHIHAELGEIIAKEKEGRINDEEITVFKSVGLALQDAVTAVRAYEIAKESGVGTTINI